MRDSAISFGRFLILAAIAQAVIVAALFHSAFFAGDQLLGIGVSDLHTYYYCQRIFAFGQIARAHFPFWNPHSYSGTPFFANPSAAMLFPPNYLHLIFSPAAAINSIIMLHVFLAGFFAAIYLRNRSHSALASLTGGICFSLSAAIILRVYAGHIAHVCTIAYTPLIFFCVDRLLAGASAPMLVLLALAVAFQSLGGEPQIAYYTGLAVLVYVGLEIFIAKPPAAGRRAGMVLLGFTLAGGLIAIQLLPEMHVAAVSVRGGGTSLQFASTDPVSPANFLELLVPEILGNFANEPYIGPYIPTEVRIYCGCAVFILAILGILRGGRTVKIALPICLIFMILSMGAKTPVYPFLYRWLPGFHFFRESGRFHFVTNLFLVLLFAHGVDGLWQTASRKPIVVFVISATALWCIAAFLSSESNQHGAGIWGEFIRSAATTRGGIFATTLDTFPQLPESTAHFAAMQAARAAAVISLLLLIMICSRAIFPFAAALIAVAELFCIAGVYCPVSPALPPYPPEWAAVQKQIAPDQRILTDDFSWANYALISGANDAFGYDPIALSRYGQFLYLTQGFSPQANYISPIQRITPLLQILRCRFVLCTNGDEHPVIELKHPLPHVLLIGDAIVQPNDNAAFAVMNSPAFDAKKQVVLSQPPAIQPAPAGSNGAVRIVSQTTDSLEIQADNPSPAILLITDSYDTGWHAKAFPDSSQKNYDLILADYTLRAVPLAAGHHHLNIYYLPPGLYTGAFITALSALFATFLLLRPRNRRPA